jgi:division protein CdvB (Snf7/Vps24/ESCRT-III family)
MSKELDKRIKIDVKKLRMENYIARLIEVVEKNQRPRPDGSIDWNKAIPKLEELQNYILDEQKKEIVERMKEEIDLLGEPNDILHEDLDNILNKIND